MSANSGRTRGSGQNLYSRAFLSIYDWFALGLHCRYVWQCPSGNVLNFYNQHISASHLDIGVGTGYFPENHIEIHGCAAFFRARR